MASAVKFLVVAVSIAYCLSFAAAAVKTISQRNKDLLDGINNAVKAKVNAKCFTAYELNAKKATTEALVDTFCVTITNDKTALDKACTVQVFPEVKKLVCEKVKQSSDERKTWVTDKYTKAYNKLSKTCQTKAGAAATLTTWLLIESLCDNIKTVDVADFKKKCPKDEYGDLKKVVCGEEGGASAIFAGFMTIGLGLMASFVTKM